MRAPPPKPSFFCVHPPPRCGLTVSPFSQYRHAVRMYTQLARFSVHVYPPFHPELSILPFPRSLSNASSLPYIYIYLGVYIYVCIAHKPHHPTVHTALHHMMALRAQPTAAPPATSEALRGGSSPMRVNEFFCRDGDDELNINPPTPCQIGKRPPAPKPKRESANPPTKLHHAVPNWQATASTWKPALTPAGHRGVASTSALHLRHATHARLGGGVLF